MGKPLLRFFSARFFVEEKDIDQNGFDGYFLDMEKALPIRQLFRGLESLHSKQYRRFVYTISWTQ